MADLAFLKKHAQNYSVLCVEQYSGCTCANSAFGIHVVEDIHDSTSTVHIVQ